MDEPVLEIWISDDDPRFVHALALANEVVSALTYLVVEPAANGTAVMPTLSEVCSEVFADEDSVLMPMVVFALGRTARNLVEALACERRCTTAEVLREFLLRPTGDA